MRVLGTLLLILAFFNDEVHAQKKLVIHVYEAETNKPVSKATLKSSSNNISIETDLNGNAEVLTNDLIGADTLMISHISYSIRKIPISVLLQKPKVMLIPKTHMLRELIIFNRKRKTVTINRYNKTIPFLAGLKMAAQRLVSPRPGALLKTISLERNIKNGSNPKTRFILHFFDIDTDTGGPGGELLPEGIEVNDKDHSKIIIDLSDCELIIPGKEFFVAVEWLYIPINQYIRIRSEMFPVTEYENGQKIPWIEYTGNPSFILGKQGARPENDKQFQRVKIASGAQVSKVNQFGRLIEEPVTHYQYWFNPQLRAVLGDGPSQIWINDGTPNKPKWRSDAFRKGARLAITATLNY